MLELRPSCEHCNSALPPEATDAMICSFECTFCATCALHLLGNVCPNCGGGFAARPVRPRENRRNENHLAKYPASARVVYKPVDLDSHAVLVRSCGVIAPERR